MLRAVSTLCLLFSLASSPALPSLHICVSAGTCKSAGTSGEQHDLFALLRAHRGFDQWQRGRLRRKCLHRWPVQKNILDFGGRVTLASHARIGGRILVFGGHLHQDANATIGRNLLVIPPIVFLPILLVLAVFVAGLLFLLRLYGSAPAHFRLCLDSDMQITGRNLALRRL